MDQGTKVIAETFHEKSTVLDGIRPELLLKGDETIGARALLSTGQVLGPQGLCGNSVLLLLLFRWL